MEWLHDWNVHSKRIIIIIIIIIITYLLSSLTKYFPYSPNGQSAIQRRCVRPWLVHPPWTDLEHCGRAAECMEYDVLQTWPSNAVVNSSTDIQKHADSIISGTILRVRRSNQQCQSTSVQQVKGQALYKVKRNKYIAYIYIYFKLHVHSTTKSKDSEVCGELRANKIK